MKSLVEVKCEFFDDMLEEIVKSAEWVEAHAMFIHKTDEYFSFFPEGRYVIEVQNNDICIPLLEEISIVAQKEIYNFNKYDNSGSAIIYSAKGEPTTLPEGVYYKGVKVSEL